VLGTGTASHNTLLTSGSGAGPLKVFDRGFAAQGPRLHEPEMMRVGRLANGGTDVFGLAGFLRNDNLVSHSGCLGRIDSTSSQRTYREQCGLASVLLGHCEAVKGACVLWTIQHDRSRPEASDVLRRAEESRGSGTSTLSGVEIESEAAGTDKSERGRLPHPASWCMQQ
jgi:hypothetical protein